MSFNINLTPNKLMGGVPREDLLAFIGEPVLKEDRHPAERDPLWLDVYNTNFKQKVYDKANVSDATHSMWMAKGYSPTLAVRISQGLIDLIDENCIYSGARAQDYYLQLLDDGRLFVNYQSIIGSRYLIDLDEDQVDSLASSYAVLLMAKFPDETGENAVAVADGVTAEIGKLILDGNTIRLPEDKLQHYGRIKFLIEQGGGKYGRGGVFTFKEGYSAADLLENLLAGEKVNHQQATQSFFTPQELAQDVCLAAGDLSGKRLLEPSAGDGALADEAKRRGAEVVVVENFKPNALQLSQKGYDVIERDFLSVTPEDLGLFDVIVANPPFTKNADIDHVMHMIKFLKPGGVLSTVMSASWRNGSQRKQVEFADFLKEKNARIQVIPAGTFKESGTMVETTHVVLTA